MESDQEMDGLINLQVNTNKLGASVFNASMPLASDTWLMQKAANDINNYLLTISTNTFSDKNLRKTLIEILDNALGKARIDGHDECLIQAYKKIEEDLIKASPTFKHTILKSDLLKIGKATRKEIFEALQPGSNGYDIKTRKDKELEDTKQQLKNLQIQMTQMMNLLMQSNIIQAQDLAPLSIENQLEYPQQTNLIGRDSPISARQRQARIEYPSDEEKLDSNSRRFAK